MSRRPRAATLLALPGFFLVIFVGVIYLLRRILSRSLVRLGDFTPPGVQALLNTWNGIAPQPLHLAVMAVIAVLAGAAAARLIRWE